MATLQQRGDSFRILFVWHGKRHAFTIGKVEPGEAEAKAAQVEYLLMRLQQRLLTLPVGCDIETFLQFDGQPPPETEATASSDARVEWLLGNFTDRYLETNAPSLELSTVGGIRRHFKHLTRTYGERYPITELTMADLQKHVDRRTKDRYRKRPINSATIRKEIVSLRTAWNWGVRMKYVSGRFPATGLRYPKVDEKPPFMTRTEILRRIASGANAKELWHSLFLTVAEIEELLRHVQEHAQHGFLYPMFCFAAHTGARRSELLRAEVGDVDLIGESVLLRERKRVQGKRTTRRVPLSPFLRDALQQWLPVHPGGSHLFSQATRVLRSRKERGSLSPLTQFEAHHHFQRVLKRSEWQVLRGWHALRHSFISACVMKGTDQRLIDAWVGHTTEEQRRRYTHLYPAVEQQAIRSVFG
jgi:integrase